MTRISVDPANHATCMAWRLEYYGFRMHMHKFPLQGKYRSSMLKGMLYRK